MPPYMFDGPTVRLSGTMACRHKRPEIFPEHICAAQYVSGQSVKNAYRMTHGDIHPRIIKRQPN